jgi:hypothetical protein
MINKRCLKCDVDSVKVSSEKGADSKTKPALPNNSINGKESSIIQCTCGAKILIVPDLAAMKRAIQNHKVRHREANEQLLAEQVLKLVAEKEE